MTHKSYIVQTPLRLDGKRVLAGARVELADKAAAELVACGAVTAPDDAKAESDTGLDTNSPEARAQTEVSGSDAAASVVADAASAEGSVEALSGDGGPPGDMEARAKVKKRTR